MSDKIKITFPDGDSKEYDKGITPFEIAIGISKGLANEILVAELNGVQTDLTTPILNDSKIVFRKFDSEKGKEVYWHTSSHMMAQAIEELYPGAKFGVGPAIEQGFYYDVDIDKKFTDEDLKKIEEQMHKIAKRDLKPEREEMTRADAIEYFKAKRIDPYKVEILETIAKDEESVSLYHQDSFTDLCRGPHLPSTAKVKTIKLLSVSGSYWRGDESRNMLQRIYGITFPEQKMLDKFLDNLEEAKKRDHRKLGRELELFSIHEEAGAGLIYWHPKGARIRLAIEDYWRKAHLDNGYEMLYTPHMGKSWLWDTSGHLDFYKDNMFAKMDVDEQDYFIKPMNCPFHIMIYKSKLHSYRDLPLRWAELGTVYRYEKSGVLHGLLRVRGFTQDDAHVFCTHEQVEDEIVEVIRFAKEIWKTFGFEKLRYYLSTKPEKAVGEDALWEKATVSLKNALERESIEYKVDEGEGVFYGPKIDIKIKDALNREWQMSTIQFDFNLPERFDMKYIGEDGKEHRPFMIHRALLGSIERFFGVLIEHFAGEFPLWLAPVQVAVFTISDSQKDYANEIYEELKKENIRVILDERNEKIGYKIREAETKKIPYMIVLGDKEKENRNISLRKHGKGDLGKFELKEFIKKVTFSIKQRTDRDILQ